MAHIVVGKAIDMCFFNFQFRVVYSSNPVLCTENIIDMDYT
jgi:hypothetical protein